MAILSTSGKCTEVEFSVNKSIQTIASSISSMTEKKNDQDDSSKYDISNVFHLVQAAIPTMHHISPAGTSMIVQNDSAVEGLVEDQCLLDIMPMLFFAKTESK